MKKITTVLALFVLALFATSCNSEPTLQEYLVSVQGKKGYFNMDIPVSVIKPKSLNVSDDVKKTINSIEKVSLFGMPFDNTEAFQAEKEKLNKIFKNKERYKNLMRMNTDGYKISVYYTGSADAIDEVIAYGYSKEKGLGVARLLGEDMQPGKIMEMMNNINVDGKGLNLGALNMGF